MSWSVSYSNKTVAGAKRKANFDASLGLPPIIRALIVDALNAIPERPDHIVRVTGHGHQASGTDYEVSSVTLKVEPVPVFELISGLGE